MMSNKHDYDAILSAIQADPRYVSNLSWGKPRQGHPEGSVRAHIAELEGNLKRLSHKLTQAEIAKLRVLIHTHDTFKAEATSGVPILDPRSHASLARAFLAEYCDNAELLAIVQYHDEPYALWQRVRSKGAVDEQRLESLLQSINDWTLFLAFIIIDGCTAGKSGEPVLWFLSLVLNRVDSRIVLDDAV